MIHKLTLEVLVKEENNKLTLDFNDLKKKILEHFDHKPDVLSITGRITTHPFGGV